MRLAKSKIVVISAAPLTPFSLVRRDRNETPRGNSQAKVRPEILANPGNGELAKEEGPVPMRVEDSC